MKNFRLSLCEALIERLLLLASLEENTQFQDVYLDVLRKSMTARTRLRRSSGCCAQNA